ncbi:ras suppressor protein 1-like isoform X2 [Paramacrobiotus metropolitanus]|uniref:ras suppressor protein 1-like isoform X2 n=1 Tax=Paramacrobiotus metropolitanus TaxID=2943436 RepID=UPI002446556F|nr:ras suppressor protein 1-like isoform X2 [Paramacrobiotus metropolitanus]XP_055330009.1 ras suppressor protein 1-like isoform X2 [Paramacrobiotus metropolitanus]
MWLTTTTSLWLLGFISEFSLAVSMQQLVRLNLAHNKLKSVPPAIADLVNLESLNLYNNHIEELPTSISGLQRLRILKLGLNRLWSLPRGFGALASLEILDLTYNNLNERVLPGNFFMMETLRALYLGDNDFEMLPAEIGQLHNLQILVLRDNDLASLPKEVGQLKNLRELHIQGNRLQLLPAEIGNLDLVGPRQLFRLEDNPWINPIAEQLQIGTQHLLDLLRSVNYQSISSRHLQAGAAIPPGMQDKSRKESRRKD